MHYQLKKKIIIKNITNESLNKQTIIMMDETEQSFCNKTKKIKNKNTL